MTFRDITTNEQLEDVLQSVRELTGLKDLDISSVAKYKLVLRDNGGEKYLTGLWSPKLGKTEMYNALKTVESILETMQQRKLSVKEIESQ